jgi:hypothetical protein
MESAFFSARLLQFAMFFSLRLMSADFFSLPFGRNTHAEGKRSLLRQEYPAEFQTHA